MLWPWLVTPALVERRQPEPALPWDEMGSRGWEAALIDQSPSDQRRPFCPFPSSKSEFILRMPDRVWCLPWKAI